MTTVQKEITINADRATVFEAYVEHIDRWWPRMGTYRYSFAGPATEPRHIRFEPQLNGRLYEEFTDGTEYVIGHITSWEPPDRLVYTWRDPKWQTQTIVEVTFIENEGKTTVTVTHAGFGENGIPDVGDGYQIGQKEILAALADWIVR